MTMSMLAWTTVAHALTNDQISTIDTTARKALADGGVPAASIAVVQDGKIVYTQAYGV
ncbi:MAG: hypothetical protein ACYDD1_02210 [Caulobacteraceae bacterium]